MDANQIASQTIEGAVIIRRPVETVFGFYRDFRNLPRFRGDVVHVELTGYRASRRTIRTPFGFDVNWPVLVTEIQPNAFIAYEMQSLPAPLRWHVAFALADEGAVTIVRERMAIPGGKVVEIVFRALGKPPVREVHDNSIRLYWKRAGSQRWTMLSAAADGLRRPASCRLMTT
jgi:uncharacterized membrane protein